MFHNNCMFISILLVGLLMIVHTHGAKNVAKLQSSSKMKNLLDVVQQEIVRKTLPQTIANDPTFLYSTSEHNATAFMRDEITYNKFHMYVTAYMQDYTFLADNEGYRQLVGFVTEYFSEAKNNQYYELVYPNDGFKRDYLGEYLKTRRSKRHLSPELLQQLNTDEEVYEKLNKALENRLTVLMMNKANVPEERFFFEHILNSIDDLRFHTSITKYYEWKKSLNDYIDQLKSIIDQFVLMIQPKLRSK